MEIATTDLTDFEWAVIAPMLPTKVRGIKRVDDRRILNGILWRLRTGRSWASIPQRYGSPTTCQSRFRRWRDSGIWDRILDAVTEAYRGEIDLVPSSAVGVPPCFSKLPRPSNDPVAWLARVA